MIRLSSILLPLILLLALCLRLWGINYDLPYIFHPDEPIYLGVSLRMFRSGDPNPRFFSYPSLFFYLNTIAYFPYYVAGYLSGVFESRSALADPMTIVMGVSKAPFPTLVLLSRLLTTLFGVGTVAVVYRLGKQLTGHATIGLLAALFLAVSPSNVIHSRYITPDTFVAFFAALCGLACLGIYRNARVIDYVWAGLLAGLTASSKYNGGIVVVTIIAAHYLRFGFAGFRHRNLYIALIASGLGFLATTPYALLDFDAFWTSLQSERIHYSTGHDGMEGESLRFYLSMMWQTMGVIYIFAGLEVVRAFFTRSKALLLISAFPVLYFAFISSFIVRNDRTFLPLTPFLTILAASFLFFAFHFLRVQLVQSNNRLLYGLSTALIVLALMVPLNHVATSTTVLYSADNRNIARQWIDQNLPSGSKIALESYSPFVNPIDYDVSGYLRIIDHDPVWFMNNEYDYLIFSQGLYGRYYAQPNQYEDQVAQYNQFFSQFELVKTFPSDRLEIRIYSVR